MDGRRVYYSFHDMPLEGGYYGDYGSYGGYGGRRGITFSRTEIVHILVSMAVLTVAFSFVFVPYPPLSHRVSP